VPQPNTLAEKITEAEAPAWTKKKVWPYVAAAAALPPYAAYRTVKGAFEVAKKLPEAMKEAPSLMYAPKEYMQKHGDTALAAAGALSAGRLTANPKNAELGIGLKSIVKGLRKDAVVARELEADFRKRGVPTDYIRDELNIPSSKDILDTIEIAKSVSPKMYRGLHSIGFSGEISPYAGEYLARGAEGKRASAGINYLSGRDVKAPGIAFAEKSPTIFLHEMEHYLDDVGVFPSSTNKIMEEIDNYLIGKYGSGTGYELSVNEYVADTVSNILRDIGGKITKEKWNSVRDEVLKHALAPTETMPTLGVPRWSRHVTSPMRKDAAEAYKRSSLARPKQ
jgi:hypothetical protein